MDRPAVAPYSGGFLFAVNLCTHARYKGSSPIKKRPAPKDPPRTLRIGVRWGPRGVRLLASQVPLCTPSCIRLRRRTCPFTNQDPHSGDATPCRMTGGALHGHVRKENSRSGHPTRGCIPRRTRVQGAGCRVQGAGGGARRYTWRARGGGAPPRAPLLRGHTMYRGTSPITKRSSS